MPPRLLPTPKSSKYVEEFLAQPVNAFGKGPQNAQFAAQFANALATGFAGYQEGKREEAQSAELAHILSQAVAPQAASLTDAVAGQFGPRLPEPSPRSRAGQQEFVRGSLLESGDPALQRMGTEFALKNIMSDAPPLETTELFPPKGSGSEVRTVVATNPAQVRSLVAQGYTLSDQRQTGPRQLQEFSFQRDGKWWKHYKEYNPDTKKWDVIPDSESPLYQPEKPTHKVFFDQTGQGRPSKDVLTNDPKYKTLIADPDWSTDERDPPTQMLEYFNSITNKRKFVRQGSSEEDELVTTDGWTLEKPADPKDTKQYWKAGVSKIVRKGGADEDALIEEGGWSTERETEDEEIIVFYDATKQNRPPVNMLKNDPMFETYLKDSEWTTQVAPNQPSPQDIIQAKRATILAAIPLPDYGPQDDGEGGTTIPTEPQQRAEIALQYWQRVYAAEKGAGTLSGPDGPERTLKLMEKIEAAQQALDPEPGYTGDTLQVQMRNDLNTIGRRIAKGESITYEQAQLYENARAERTTVQKIVNPVTNEITIFTPKLDTTLYPPLDQAIISDAPDITPTKGEETGDWQAQLQESLKDAGYELRTIRSGDDLSLPVKGFLDEAATIMENAARNKKNIYGLMGWGKKLVAPYARQLVPTLKQREWGLEAQKLDKVLLEIQLALAPEKLQESKFTDYERKMIKLIVGEINAAGDEATIRMSLVRLATAIQQADMRLQR